MLVFSARHDHLMKSDVIIERPSGFREGQNLVILQRSPAYFTLNGQTRLISEDTVLILKHDQPQFYMGAGEPFVHDWFFCMPEDADREVWQRWDLPYNTPMRVSNAQVLSSIIRDIAYYNSMRSVCRKEIVSAHVHTFFWHLFDARESKHREQELLLLKTYERVMTQLRRDVYEHPEHAPAAPVAAARMHISRSMFDRIYRSRFQKSYMSDVINARIQQAKQLLTGTDLSLKEIADACGYHDQEHFARQFKQRVGVPPRQFRKEQ